MHHTSFWSSMDELCSTILHTWHHKSSYASMLNNATYLTSQIIICIIPFFGQAWMNNAQHYYIHDITSQYMHHTIFCWIIDEQCSTLLHTWHHKSSYASYHILVKHGWTLLNTTTYMKSQGIICIIPCSAESWMNYAQQCYILDITRHHIHHTIFWSSMDELCSTILHTWHHK